MKVDSDELEGRIGLVGTWAEGQAFVLVPIVSIKALESIHVNEVSLKLCQRQEELG